MFHVKPQITTDCGAPALKFAVFAECRRSASNTAPLPLLSSRFGTRKASFKTGTYFTGAGK
jgi:hypothetical protein